MNPFTDTTVYCTVDMVRAHKIDASFTDAQIEEAIALITAYIDAFYYLNLEEYLGDEFSNLADMWQYFVRYNAKTLTFSGEDNMVLPLRGVRLIRLTSVVENGSSLPLDYITVRPRGLYKYYNSCNPCDYTFYGYANKWIKGYNNILATGDWGFAGIPRNIHLVTARLVRMYLEGAVGDGIASFATAVSTADSTASTAGGEIDSFKISQPGSDIQVNFTESSTVTTNKSSQAIKKAVDNGLYMYGNTTGDPWCDRILRGFLPAMKMKVF